MLYDWLVSLDQEVACIWKPAGGLNAGSLVYALSRFPLIIALVFDIMTNLQLSLLVSNQILLYSCTVLYASTEVKQPIVAYLHCSKDTHISHTAV